MKEMSRLYQIQERVRARTEEIAAAHGNWPCRKGCDDCCRRLASVPRVTRDEWLLMESAIDALPPGIAAVLRERIRDSARNTRPVICPLLDPDTGACLIYTARPVACRSYGFYAERDKVLGCHRIETLARESQDVIWGNHESLEERLAHLGPARELFEWLSRASAETRSDPSFPPASV
ncbi:MAG TPA: YkgJ family cysteine cluster protein [Bryobacteraceae bacterium]|nr:YkgJ family cysteine cluster protein [Bryobacteraceae bacterium]